MLLSLLSLAAFASTSIAIKHIHSHSDFIIMSVEADIWRQSIQLFVADTSGEIDKTKTLNSLYLANILGIINGTKSFPTSFVLGNPLESPTYQPMHDSLQALRAGGHLTTYFNFNGKLTQGAVTVVGTGNTPLAFVIAADPRDTFFDWDIRHLYSTKPGVRLEWGPGISPLASVDCSSVSSTAQMQELVLIAHDFGVRTHFWDTPRASGHDLLAVSNAWGAFNLKALEVEG
ncbi:hypothetical protein B0H14DRAFT_2850788 [Mycena olivaceomarginata]|nr:hypothetical protein B0H14DRAFT_2850788 [Mycena olivaceomarginata]